MRKLLYCYYPATQRRARSYAHGTRVKQRLQPVAENDYTIADNETAFALALDMMPHVGSADAELRDELIYVTLAWWLERGVLTDAQQRELLTILRDDAQLFYRLGEQKPIPF